MYQNALIICTYSSLVTGNRDKFTRGLQYFLQVGRVGNKLVGITKTADSPMPGCWSGELAER